MRDWNRKHLHQFVKHSEVEKGDLHSFLRTHVYPSPHNLRSLLRLFLGVMGGGFFLIGLVFFFAFNWEALHKFVKFGLILIVLLGLLIPLLSGKVSQQASQWLLLGMSLVWGVLFAVYGQVYQTGANAYDFFGTWALSILPFVLLSRGSAPLFLMWLALLNTTLFFYFQQIASVTDVSFELLAYIGLNGVFFLLSMGDLFTPKVKWFPSWFTLTVGSLVLFLLGLAQVWLVWIKDLPTFFVLMMCLYFLVFYGVGLLYTVKKKQVWLVAWMAFSLLITFVAAIIREEHDNRDMIIIVTFLMLIGVSFIAYLLHTLHNYWKNGA